MENKIILKKINKNIGYIYDSRNVNHDRRGYNSGQSYKHFMLTTLGS